MVKPLTRARPKVALDGSPPRGWRSGAQPAEGGQGAADLDQADAHDDLGQPVRDLLQVAVIAVVAGRAAPLGAPRDAEQEADDAADEGGRAGHRQRGGKGRPPDGGGHRRGIDEGDQHPGAG